MCDFCNLTKRPADTQALRAALTTVFENISATLSSRQGDGALRQFFVQKLRQTADEIEMNTVAERSFIRDLREIEKGVDSKRLVVEAHLLKEEAAFYQHFGMTMPHSVRAAVTSRVWDSLDQEIDNAGTQQQPSGDHDGDGVRLSAPTVRPPNGDGC